MKRRKGFEIRGELRFKNARLVAAREELGMTQKAFAEHLGINYIAYNSYENLRAYPGPKHRGILATFCCMSEEELFPPELQKYAEGDEPRVLISTAIIEPSRLLSANRREVLSLPAPNHTDENLSQQELESLISKILPTLKKKEARVVSLYYGLNGQAPMTLFEIGGLMGVTTERARQIKERALVRLGHASRGIHFKPFFDEVEGIQLAHMKPSGPAELDENTRTGLKEYHERLAQMGLRPKKTH